MTVPLPVRAAAPAKLNLYLHVLGRRPDGYHLLDSLVVFAGLCDVVEVAPAETFRLCIDGPFAAPLRAEDPERNLVTRACRRLAEAVGRAPDVAVTLHKRLPVAGGIGGGSSDAAAALRALAALWGLDPDDPRPAAVAPGLGADVPVCLHGRSAYFGGIGDVIDPAPALPPVWLVLVNPGIGLGTKEVFGARRDGFSTAGRLERAPADLSDFVTMLEERGNDLMAPAIALAPVVAEVLDALRGTAGCRLARMSGSGATCFGLFGSETDARAAAAGLRAARPGWWAEAAPLLPQVPAVEIAG
ncbi:4-(cytidine 5'-diphospho)-2-C-methyl-D-erythritol kinase [Rhodospirillum centenum]|uniref:4-diphosphocytidyl-2-C-methyl-D-erythritol kinase n=1 Tax=Rhodospirillum centenum (strain ATCC 51521 / SW) TaxID=414684 RepID=B6IW69_RHOCS|nr:4-(cytidine 5'-diphospho)-2-C-methyl-D-erythritol kinase [Rhodospirillum centenum]ACJ00543.1 4-diphosphocytidyl-2C-methyl-D-erythritol kinase [Rhodospirillum centenum SW]